MLDRAGTVDLVIEGVAPVPWRARSRVSPPAIVLEFSGEVPDLAGFSAPAVVSVERGMVGDGWGRIVLWLQRPYRIETAELQSGRMHLRLAEQRSRQADRGAAASAPRRVVVIDPGHGGIDPGAIRDGIAEKTVMLAAAEALAGRLRTRGYDVRLTRQEDRFLALDDRVAFARQAGADLFLSLHANTEASGAARGATVYVAAAIPSDPAADALALLENQADAAAGPARGQEADDIGQALLAMAAPATQARSEIAAEHLAAGLAESVGLIRSNPIRGADFRVLRAPDVPSVLLELGFLSHKGDRADLQDPGWRRAMAAALADAVDRWFEADAAYLALMEQG